MWPSAPSRIEHAQHVRPEDIARFAQHGIIASMQPIHQASDWPWARARLGPARVAGAYAWRSMQRAGVPLAFGSDFPIESEDPRLGLRATVDRLVEQGAPDERLTPDEALRAFTVGAAQASFAEEDAGRFAVGQRADFALFHGDPRADPLAARAEATFLDGVATL
jgi:predicted amidohydrolase YtcJ